MCFLNFNNQLFFFQYSIFSSSSFKKRDKGIRQNPLPYIIIFSKFLGTYHLIIYHMTNSSTRYECIMYFDFLILFLLIFKTELSGLNNLEYLILDYSSINGSFLDNAGVMTSLRILSLSECGLRGSLPAQGIYEFIHECLFPFHVLLLRC